MSYLARVGFKLLEENALGRDLAQNLPVRRARHAKADRAGCTVPRQTNHTHVVAKVLACGQRQVLHK
jgi:hypothetical protein